MKKKKIKKRIEFGNTWFASKEEKTEKDKLVDDTLQAFISLKPVYKKYYQEERISIFVKIAYVITGLKPVTVEMLSKYITGFSMLGFAQKQETFDKYLYEFIAPAYKVLYDFFATDVYQEHLLTTEVSGTAQQFIGDMVFTETRNDILLHIKRMGVVPISTEHINQIKRDLRKFNQENYSSDNKTIRTGNSKLAKTQNIPTSFDELFENPETIQDCVDILKKVDPPILNVNDKFIGKLKSAFCVWIEVLQREGYVKHFSDRNIYAKLISERFSPFSINESMFGKTQKRAESLYKLPFTTLLSKLSQNRKLGK